MPTPWSKQERHSPNVLKTKENNYKLNTKENDNKLGYYLNLVSNSPDDEPDPAPASGATLTSPAVKNLPVVDSSVPVDDISPDPAPGPVNKLPALDAPAPDTVATKVPNAPEVDAYTKLLEKHAGERAHREEERQKKRTFPKRRRCPH